ncbi:F-box/kelch-repeat protein At3g23880-like [Vicia villosa]|uniref:F-box/kelch-repeat protein At3g23880-like n=1 Tax=Vicia villosa TaxID=3911 RepID=UPI00273C7807|nr:F-box/kelch-repeat protein At3g23880-like [Vicia villosa]
MHRETSPVTLPDQLVAEVLSSHKVKLLLQFKCVNKSWNSLISDPFFIKMHLIKSSKNPHVILSFSSTSSIALLNPFLIRSLLENPSINIINHDSIYKLAQSNCQIIGSCTGLICLVRSYYKTELHLWNPAAEFYLWNPATRWLSPKLASFHHFSCWDLDSCFKFSFGYDNLTDKYKLVAFHLNEVRVLSFGDNVWRNIQSFPTNPYEYNSNHVNAGVYLSNSLNWFALRDNIRPNYYGCKYLSVQQFVIISLDLRIETYTELQFPRGFDQVPVVPPIVWVLMECLCFSHYSTGFNFVIWQMKEFGVQESWTKMLKFDYHNILQSDSYEVVSLLPLYVFENEDMLIFSPNLKQLICYNWRENRVVRQATVTDSTFMRLCTANQYVESLVSAY